MDIIVQKYGGTSVENKEKLEKVCENIISYKNNGENLVVVVSAQGKTTDLLINKAHEYVNYINMRDLDLLLSTGEIKTAALLSMMLNDKGYDAISLTGMQAGIISDGIYGNSKIKNIYSQNIHKYLKKGKIVVVTGFQAVDRMGNITTLGRGGSDLSAVAIASSLKAKKCEIYSDIDGIYSADPKVISNSKLLEQISYDEMLEAASAGAKVLHNRSVNVAKEYNIPLVVKNSQKESRGSIVSEKIIEEYKIKFITKKDDVSKVCIVGNMIMSNKEVISKIFDIAQKEQINIYMISFSELAINIIIDENKTDLFMKRIHRELIENKV